MSISLDDLSSLQAYCGQVRLEPGDPLRQQKHYYRDAYVLVDGVEVERVGSGGAVESLRLCAGASVGAAEFLHGSVSTDDVIARTPCRALFIDDPTLVRLEAEQPLLKARLMCELTASAETNALPVSGLEIHLCRSAEMLERAQRLRYEVYCQELGRSSPHADHERKIIRDDLDEIGYVFLALEDGEAIGTLRANLSREGSVGALEERYGMHRSQLHPIATVVCTKFIVKKAKRGGAVSMKLVSAVMRSGMRVGMKECYIDCVPRLLHYYKALGFTVTGERFIHPENGLSYPMMLDVAKHGARLCDLAGPEYLKLYLSAQAIKSIDALRRRYQRAVAA